MLLHAMLRVSDPEKTIKFFELFGLKEVRRINQPFGRFTLIFLSDQKQRFEIELTHNWDEKDYDGGRNFGHLAYAVDNIYEFCQALKDKGVTINRPPRDGRMAFVRSPDNVSIELLQSGEPLAPQEPWVSMENIGEW